MQLEFTPVLISRMPVSPELPSSLTLSNLIYTEEQFNSTNNIKNLQHETEAFLHSPTYLP